MSLVWTSKWYQSRIANRLQCEAPKIFDSVQWCSKRSSTHNSDRAIWIAMWTAFDANLSCEGTLAFLILEAWSPPAISCGFLQCAPRKAQFSAGNCICPQERQCMLLQENLFCSCLLHCASKWHYRLRRRITFALQIEKKNYFRNNLEFHSRYRRRTLILGGVIVSQQMQKQLFFAA